MAAALPDWPFLGYASDVRPALRAARRAGDAVTLATITGLDGGGPRPVGAQMLVSEEAAYGFLSGGCVEGDVVTHARECLRTGRPQRLIYGDGSPWFDIKLLCGRRMEVLIERVAADDLAAATLLALGQTRVPAIWITDGERRLCGELDANTASLAWAGASTRRYDPQFALYIVGKDPVALALASLASQAELLTTLIVVDGPVVGPSLQRVNYVRARRDAPLAGVSLDAWSGVAVLTHDAELDDSVLTTALRSPAAYVGLLGARSRLAERLQALRADGIDETGLTRLRAPIGLDLGGKAPWEVAISIVAEVIATRYGRGEAGV